MIPRTNTQQKLEYTLHGIKNGAFKFIFFTDLNLKIIPW